MASRMQNRFQMLIDVSVGGAQNLSKLASSAKKSAVDMKGLNKAVKENNSQIDIAKQRLRAFATNVKTLTNTNKKLIESEKSLKTSRIQSIAAQKTYAEQLKKVAAAEKAVAAAKGMKGSVKAVEAAQQKAISLLRQERLALTKTNTIRKKADRTRAAGEKNIRKLASSMTKLKNEINKVSGGYIKWDGRTRKLKNQTAHLTRTMQQARAAAGKLGKESKTIEKGQRSNKKSIDKTTKALQKQAHAFTNLSQRIHNGGEGLAHMRQVLGRLRNQLLVLAFATRALRNAFGSAFEASRQMEAALKGLNTVAINNGNALGVAQEAAMGLAEDGLLSITEAAAGLKNLLSAGFGMNQAINLMNTLTDAASFNRQGTLALGVAVVGATQGIKNQNSIMVDNAGITKNLSIMQKEYAASIGTTIGKLDEAGKRSAIYSGILKEGSQFAGDAVKVLATMEGQLAKLKVQTFNASAAVGDVLKPAMMEMTRLFASAAESVSAFLADEEKMESFSRNSRAAGKAMAKAFTMIGSVVGKTIGSITSIVDATVGLANVASTFLKIMVILKAKSIIMTKYNAIVKATAASTAQHAFASSLATKKIFLFNSATGKQIFGLRKIWVTLKMGAKGMKLYRTGLRQTTDGTLLATFSIKNMTLALKGLWLKFKVIPGKMIAGFKGVAASARGASAAVRILGGGMKILRVAIKSLLVSLGPLFLAFAAFEAVIWIWDRIFGAKDRAKQFSKDVAAMKSSLASLEKQFNSYGKMIARTDAQLKSRGLKIELQVFRDKEKAAEKHYDTLAGLMKNFQKIRDEDKRAEAQEAIDIQQGLYEQAVDALISYQQQQMRAISAFDARKMAIIQFVEAEKNATLKRLNLDEVVATEVKYRNLLKMEQEFYEMGGQMYRQNVLETDRIMKGLIATRTRIEEERLSYFVKIREAYAKKIVGIEKSINNDIAKANDDWYDQIVDMYTNKGNARRDALDKELDGAVAQLKALPVIFKDAAQKASDEVADVWKSGLRDSDLLSAFHEKAFKGDDMQFWFREARAELEDFTFSIRNFETMINSSKNPLGNRYDPGSKQWLKAMDLMKKKSEDLGLTMKVIAGESLAEQKRLKPYTDALGVMKNKVDNVIVSYEEWILANDSYTDSSKRSQIEIDALHKKHNELQLQNANAITTLMDMALSQKAVTISMAEFRKELAGNVEAMKAFNKMVEYQNKDKAIKDPRISNLEALIPLLNTMNDIEKKYALAKAKVIAQRDKEIGQMSNKINAAKLEIAYLQKIADGTVKTTKRKTDALPIDRQAARDKIAALTMEVNAWANAKNAAGIYFTNLITNLENLKKGELFAVIIDGINSMANSYLNHWNKMKDMENQSLIEHKKRLQDWKKMKNDKEISNEQYNQLETASNQLRIAENEKNDKLALAGLYKMVAQEITAAAARVAARQAWSIPGVLAAIAILGAGFGAAAWLHTKARDLEASAELDFSQAQQDFETSRSEIMGEDEPGADGGSTGARKFGGTIRAEQMEVTISPTVVISGQSIFIGQGSVTEFQSELSTLILESTQQAIDNREIDLSNAGGLLDG